MIDMVAIFSNGRCPLNKEQAEKEALNLGYETLLCITDKDTFSGRSSYGIWCVGIPEDYFRIKNFINYENVHRRKVIIWSRHSELIEKIYSNIFSISEGKEKYIIKLDDVKYVCHSTTIESFYEILKDGKLLSYSELIKRKKKVKTVRFQLKEPEDYLEYINLCACDSVASEIVMASRQYGRINCDAELRYKPGVRIYFDREKLLSMYEVYPDGLHMFAAHKRLPLDLACAFVFPSERIMKGFIKNKNFKEEHLKKICSIKKEKQYWTPGEYILEVNALLTKKGMKSNDL
ncbi:hypothetical protein [Haloimpatiens massiliensis]|uniref:hypothetical protein n=1 Tax=Haloimpatiens massiliensis TaxID=1658110 RepID=UPI000C84B579|nr:hypothetical protein [Haloimpatiens massiliensis]